MNTTRHSLARLSASFMLLATAAAAMASDAQTSASANSGRGRSGAAMGTARYEGDLGFARTDTRSGAVNAARSVALGVDENGLSLSLSTAVAPRNGPAFGTNLNVSIGNNGEVSLSTGRATATGGSERGVTVGGATNTGNRHRSGSAISQATGRTSNGGVAQATTNSRHYPGRQRFVPRRPSGRAVPYQAPRPVVTVGSGAPRMVIGASSQHSRTAHRKVVKRTVVKRRVIRR